MNKAHCQRWGATILLAGILAAGLWVRFAGLSTIQHLQCDQGRDYLVVMDWFENGVWPLLGPSRSYGGYSIGPGWFYTIAPLMALFGYHPTSGPATVILLSLGMQILAWWWVRRVTGSMAAGVAAAAAFALGSDWVVNDRVLWNPNALAFGVVALACLLELLETRPLYSLCSLVLICMILPQWHTAGLVPAAAALGFAAPIVWRARHRLAAIPPRRWILASCVLLVGFGFLYGPPIVYEFTSHNSNLAEYVGAGYPLDSGSGHTAVHRLGTSFGEMLALVTVRTLGRFGRVAGAVWVFWILLGLCFAMAAGVALRRSGPQSLRFLLVLPAGYWIGGAVLSRAPMSYQYSALAPVPVLLLTCLGGYGLQAVRGSKGERVRRWAGITGLVLLALLVVADFPAAWRVHTGRVWYGRHFQRTRDIVSRILDCTRGRPYSFILVEPGNNASHFHYLLRLRDRLPLNRNLDTAGVTGDEVGEVFVLLTRGDAQTIAVYVNGRPEPLVPDRIADACLYWISRDELPERLASISLECGEERIDVKVNAPGV